MKKRNQDYIWHTFTIILLLTTILLAGVSVYLYGRALESENQNRTLVSKLGGISYKVDLLINFGNGTKVWYNGTLIPIGLSLLNLTESVTEGELEFTSSQYGIFVNSINGIGTKPSMSYAWLWWLFDIHQRQWVLGGVGADQYKLSDGDIVAWYYQDTSKYPDVDRPS